MSESPFVAEATFHVRYAETDAQGIVHHASYIVYFEEGRSEYIRQRGSSYAEFERSGLYLAVTEINARYIKAARYDDRLTVRCWIAKFIVVVHWYLNTKLSTQRQARNCSRAVAPIFASIVKAQLCEYRKHGNYGK
ncbi:MAG: thioesterase family protein [Anaerolineae bacterium]|nr:thioesterase family protein [Anaerolineae bacterium]